MKLEMRTRAGDDVRALWLLALCVFAGGSYYLQTRYQTAIAAAHDRTEALYRQTVADTRIVREAGGLRAIQKQAQADLARVSRDTSLSGSTANLLSMLHASARAFNASILEVRPGDAQTAQPTALHATTLTIRVRGRFRDILAFVEDLSHHETLISVAGTELAVASDTQSVAREPRLDATIHATMYRLTLPEDKELRVATAG